MLNMILYALLIFGLGIAVIRRPSVALAGILCLFGLKQWAQGTMVFFVHHGTIPNLCMGLLLLLGLLVKSFRGEAVLSPYPRVGWNTILLFFYAALSLLWAPNFNKSADLMLQALPYIITVILLTPLLISSRKDLRPVAMATLVFGGILAVLILTQVQWFNRKIVLAGTSLESEGGNPLAVAQLGGYLALSAMLLQFRNLRLMGWIMRLTFAGLGLMLIAKSGSRGQLMGLLLVLFLFVPMRQRMNHPGKLVTLSITLGVLITLALWLQSSFTTEAAVNQRWTSGKMLLDMAGRFQNLNILLGTWATDSLGSLLFGLGNSASYAIKQLGIYPHFVPGEVLAEEGLPGIILYLSVLAGSVGNLRRAYARIRDDAEARGELALFGAILFYEFLLSLKQGSLIGNTFFFGMAILIGRIRLIFEAEVPAANDGGAPGGGQQPAPWAQRYGGGAPRP